VESHPKQHFAVLSPDRADHMSTRATILSASVGVLLLTTAPSPTADLSGTEVEAHDGSALDRNTCVVQTSPATAETASFNRLSAAYAPSSVQPSDSSLSTKTASTVPVAPPVDLDDPTLWLARAIYSETKLPHEQELVAWVVRNRVETRYRGERTYREVVLDPYQFSAFNPGSSKRSFLMQLGPETPLPRWQQALWVAQYVRHAAPVYRPFPVETRHFYSERSMEDQSAPYWAEHFRFVSSDERRYTVNKRRFRFYKQTS